MVFLSYAREDATLVDHLERTLYDCGVPVCKDVPQGESDPFWRDSITRLHESASVVLVFWTKHAYASPFVDQEVRAWAGTKVFFRSDHIPLLNYDSAHDFVCDNWSDLLDRLRSRTTQNTSFQAMSHPRSTAEWRSQEANIRGRTKLEALRQRNLAPLDLFRVGDGCLQDAREGNLFRRIKGDIYIGVSAVTEGQYRRFLEDSAFRRGRYNTRTWSPENLPVVSITWYESLAYCEWFGGTLPSEDEWEIAAATRRGLSYATATGQISPNLANYAGDFTGGAPVSQQSFPSNPDGFFGMCGNTWDWCRSWWGDYRLIKGGSWMDSPRFCTVRARYRNGPPDRDCSIGFRVRLAARRKGRDAYESTGTRIALSKRESCGFG